MTLDCRPHQVSAALVDLTGGVGESIDMTDEDVRFEIGDGSFWKRLKRYNSKGAGHEHDDGGGTYLLGAALSRTDVEDKGGLGAMQVAAALHAECILVAS